MFLNRWTSTGWLGVVQFGRLITGIRRNLVRIKSYSTLHLEDEDEHIFCSLTDVVVRDQPGGRTLFMQFDIHHATSLAIMCYTHCTGKLWRQGHILIFWPLSTRMTLVRPLTANPRTALHESPYKKSDPSTNSDFPTRIRKVEQSTYSHSECWSACRVPFRKGSSLRKKIYNQFRRSNKFLLSQCILRYSVRLRRLDIHPFR